MISIVLAALKARPKTVLDRSTLTIITFHHGPTLLDIFSINAFSRLLVTIVTNAM